MSTLSLEEIAKRLGSGTKWEIKDDKLVGSFHFPDFKKAFEFVTKVAKASEDRNHHPNILIEYNVVTLTLWTHTEDSVTEKDAELASQIEKLVKNA